MTRKSSTEKGKELEDMIELLARKYGWRVEKRKKYGDRIVDLLIHRKGIAFVVQCKNTEKATPRDVTQAKRDFDEFVRFLIEEKLGMMIRPILVSNGFSEGAERRARSYGVMLYSVDELEDMLSFSKRRKSR